MKVVSRYCDSCGVKIPATDIEDEVALKYEDSYYCKECKADILPLIDKKGGSNGGGKGVAKAARAGAEVTRAESKGDAPDKKSGAPKTTSGTRPAVGGATAPKTTSGQRPAVGAAAKPAAPAKAAPAKGAPPARTPVKGAPAAKSGASAAKKPASRRPTDEDEPDDAEVTSEEELDAEQPPKSKKLLFIGLGLGAVAAIVAVAIAFGGGGGSGAPSGSTTGASVKVATTQKEKSEKIWRDALAAVKDKPLGEQIKTLQIVYDSDAFSDGEVAIQAQKQLEDMTEAFNAKGKEEFDRLFAKAKAQSDAEQYLEAIDTLRGFAEDLRSSKWFTNNVRAEIERLQLLLQAKNEALPLMKKADAYAAQKEYLLAAGVLDGFDSDEYRKSPWAEKINRTRLGFEELAAASEQSEVLAELEKKEQERIAAEQAERKKKQEEEDRRIAGMSWMQMPTDDLFTWKLPEPTKDCWKPAGKELTGKCGAALSGMQIGAVAGSGDKRWIDYIFEFKYKVVKGGFRVGVRSLGDRWVELQPEIVSDGAYHTITISVRGDGDDAFQQIKPDGSKVKIKFDAHGSTQGGICFALLPNSECVFTEVRYKIIAKTAN